MTGTTLHRFLRLWRTKKNLSLEEVGELLGKKHSTVSRWERGRTAINIVDLEALADVYGISPADLLTDPRLVARAIGLDRADKILSQLDESDRADWLRNGERLARR